MQNEKTLYCKFRMVAPGLNPKQREEMSDDMLKTHAIHQFYDIIGTEILNGKAKIKGDNHYLVRPALYEYLKMTYLLYMVDATVEVFKANKL